MASVDMIIWLGCLFILACGLLIDSLYFFSLSAKRDTLKTVKKYYRLIAIFLLALSLCGFLDLWYAYYQRYLGIQEDPLPPASASFGTYFFVITTCLMFSFFALTRTTEKYVKQSKSMILTKILFTCFLISLVPYVTPPEITDILAPLIYMVYLPFTLIILYWGVFYLRLGAKSEGIIKKKAYFTAFGLGTIFLGISGDIVIRDQLWIIETTGYLFPIIFVIGGIIGIPLLFTGFKRE